MKSVKAPDSVGDTDNFEINLYRSFDTVKDFTLSNLMLTGNKYLTKDVFKSGTISNGNFEAKVEFIQTPNVI